MSIQSTLEVTPGKVASIHRVEQLEINRTDRPNLLVRINHFADSAALATGSLVWQTLHRVPYAALALDPDALVSVEKYLIDNSEIYSGGVYSDDNEGDSLEGARILALAAVNAAYGQRVAQLTKGYPAVEQASWPQQVEEAKALALDPNAEALWLTAAAEARGLGESAVDLGAKVLSINNPYRTAHGSLTGTRQRLEREIDAAETVEDVRAIMWPGTGAPVPETAPVEE